MSGLLKGDLNGYIKNVFEVDSYKSKMGDDSGVVVLSFSATFKEPAEDLVKFVESGYDFVLDCDITPGELDDGTYLIFVEIERDKHITENILHLLEGISRLTLIDDWRFRYYKSFKSFPAKQEFLDKEIPNTVQTYDDFMSQYKMSNFHNFFATSYLESVSMNDKDNITFKKKYSNPISFRYITEGTRKDIHEKYNKIDLMMEDISNVLFYTKYIGNYNITKSQNNYIFENNGYCVVLESLQ